MLASQRRQCRHIPPRICVHTCPLLDLLVLETDVAGFPKRPHSHRRSQPLTYLWTHEPLLLVLTEMICPQSLSTVMVLLFTQPKLSKSQTSYRRCLHFSRIDSAFSISARPVASEHCWSMTCCPILSPLAATLPYLLW